MMSNLMMKNQIRLSSNSSNGKGIEEPIREWKANEETMKEWGKKYKEAKDKLYEELQKKRESRINSINSIKSINESISKTGYETVPETEIERKKEKEKEKEKDRNTNTSTNTDTVSVSRSRSRSGSGSEIEAGTGTGTGTGTGRKNGIEQKQEQEMVDKQKIKKKIKPNPFKEIVSKNKGGYNSYLQNKALLGSIADILIEEKQKYFEDIFNKNVLGLFEKGKIYSMLLQVVYVTEGEVKGSSPMKSIILNKNINSYLVIQKIKIALQNFESEYQLSNYFGKCYVCWREWLSDEDYLKGISDEEVDNIVNEVLIEDMPQLYKDNIKNKELSKIIDISNFENIISVLPKYDSIDKLHSIGKIEEKALKFEAGYVEKGDILA